MGQPVVIPNDNSMTAAIPMGRVVSTGERFIEGEHMHHPPQLNASTAKTMASE
jgi:hypothetical protein